MKYRLLFTMAVCFSAPLNASAADLNALAEEGPTKILTVANVKSLKRYAARVANCGNDLTHFKIQVKKGSIAVSSAGLRLSDGTVREYEFTAVFESGYVSDWASFSDFKSEGDCITQVFVKAQPEDSKKPGRVTLWGLFKNNIDEPQVTSAAEVT